MIANISSNIKTFMCIYCTYPFVSFILTTSKSISGQGRKMNMNSYPSWHRYVEKFSMHILMLIFYRKYVILVSCSKLQNLISWQHWYRPYCPVTRVYKHMLNHGFSKDLLLLLLVLNLSTETKKLSSKRLSTIKYFLFGINEWHKCSGFSMAFLDHSSWKDIYVVN